MSSPDLQMKWVPRVRDSRGVNDGSTHSTKPVCRALDRDRHLVESFRFEIQERETPRAHERVGARLDISTDWNNIPPRMRVLIDELLGSGEVSRADGTNEGRIEGDCCSGDVEGGAIEFTRYPPILTTSGCRPWAAPASVAQGP